MAFFLFLLQFDWKKLSPENLFGAQVLERTPAGLSIIYLIGVAVLIGFLIVSFFSNFRRPKFNFERDLPKEVRKKLSKTVTNRSLRIWQFVFIALTFFVYGFHVCRMLSMNHATKGFRGADIERTRRAIQGLALQARDLTYESTFAVVFSFLFVYAFARKLPATTVGLTKRPRPCKATGSLTR